MRCLKFYIDTEFNGHQGELISLALVSEHVKVPMSDQYTSHEFYAAREIGSPYIEWVCRNVAPVLDTPVLSVSRFRWAFHQFIQRFELPEIICDWHADAAHFCDALAGPDYESSLDFPCAIRILRTPKDGGPVSARPHNALEDARGLRDWHEKIRKAA